eukprot:350372-Chlamydomonas_euryale.AAC.7
MHCLKVAVGTRNAHGRTCALLQQELGALIPPLDAGPHQRRLLVVPSVVDAGTSIQRHLDDLGVVRGDGRMDVALDRFLGRCLRALFHHVRVLVFGVHLGHLRLAVGGFDLKLREVVPRLRHRPRHQQQPPRHRQPCPPTAGHGGAPPASNASQLRLCALVAGCPSDCGPRCWAGELCEQSRGVRAVDLRGDRGLSQRQVWAEAGDNTLPRLRVHPLYHAMHAGMLASGPRGRARIGTQGASPRDWLGFDAHGRAPALTASVYLRPADTQTYIPSTLPWPRSALASSWQRAAPRSWQRPWRSKPRCARRPCDAGTDLASELAAMRGWARGVAPCNGCDRLGTAKLLLGLEACLEARGCWYRVCLRAPRQWLQARPCT